MNLKYIFGFLLLLLSYSFAQNNYCLSFDGGDYATESVVYRNADSVGAVSAWVKFDSPINAYGFVFCSSDNTDLVTYIGFGNTNGATGFVSQRNNDTDDALATSSPSYIFTADTWYHIVFQTNAGGTAYELYVNNSLKPLTAFSGADNGDWFNSLTTPTNLTIGARLRTTASYQFKGDMDELSYHSAPLSSEQRALIYNGGTPTNIANMDLNLIDYWRFEEGDGTTTSDQDGNNTFIFAGGAALPTWTSNTPGWDASNDVAPANINRGFGGFEKYNSLPGYLK